MADAAESLPHIADLSGMIAPERTALVIVDIQVDFAAPHGLIGGHGVDMSDAEIAVDRIEELIAAARKAGATVAFMRVMTRPETDTNAMKTWMARRGTPGDGAICRVGSGGEDYYRVKPQPGDIEIEKLQYDSFHNTDLDARLRVRGIDTLVIAGISTDCCVDATASAAFHRDYHVFVVSDGCAAFGEGVHAAALNTLQSHCALLTKSAAVIGAWAG
ncbi:MAG TPA: isochorismatase family cysteine hydrolase [Sphingomonas sp.]